jgi:porphobilinogen deaminase
LRALVASADGRRIVRAEATGGIGDPEQLGRRVADGLRAQGAAEILATLPR